jgi:transcriptional regulator with XRE-family HTH domain
MRRKELAVAVGMTPTSVGQILAGIQQPGADTLSALCRELRVHPNWIMLGVEPRYLEDSSTDLPPVNTGAPVLGIDQWLAEQRDMTPDERAWMRAVPWVSPHVKQPNLVYQLVLSAYRQSHTRSPDDTRRSTQP